jgi:hypothetical protein
MRRLAFAAIVAAALVFFRLALRRSPSDAAEPQSPTAPDWSSTHWTYSPHPPRYGWPRMPLSLPQVPHVYLRKGLFPISSARLHSDTG